MESEKRPPSESWTGLLKDQGKKVGSCGSRYVPCSGRRAAHGVGAPRGVDIIGGQNGADPASIVYDAVAAAKARNADVLICDTAGRLHNKKNLMEELHKIYRILEKSTQRHTWKRWWCWMVPRARMRCSRQDSLQKWQMSPVSF